MIKLFDITDEDLAQGLIRRGSFTGPSLHIGNGFSAHGALGEFREPQCTGATRTHRRVDAGENHHNPLVILANDALEAAIYSRGTRPLFELGVESRTDLETRPRLHKLEHDERCSPCVEI